MSTSPETPRLTTKPERTYVFRFKRLRTWLGLSQEQVATIARVAVRRYRQLENRQRLPLVFETLSNIAHVFGANFRCTFMTDPEIPANEHRRVRTVAAAFRSPYLFVSFMNGERTISFRRIRVDPGEHVADSLEPLLLDFNCEELVMEPDLLEIGRLGRYSGMVRRITLMEAKRIILLDAERRTHRELFEDLVRHYAELRARVTILPTGRIAMTESWRVNQLIPSALGIALHGRDTEQDQLLPN